MNRTAKNNHNHSPKFGHAVVIGGGLSGLTTARTLIDYFDEVTIIERDRLPEGNTFRRGVPQSPHAHSLPLRGQKILEKQFPGISLELLANGAVAINGASEMAFYIAGGWHQLRHRAAIISMAYSRPLLDSVLYRRVANHPRVTIIPEQRVAGLCIDAGGQRVTGARLRHRRGLDSTERTLAADVVVDASGRHSRSPEWLASLGYTPPQETTINAFVGYASRLYKIPADFDETVAGWKTMYIRPTPTESPRGGAILPVEGNRWCVSLFGVGGDYPPTADAEFLEFSRSLPTPHLYEAIKTAQPLSGISGYRHTQTRVRHYDRLPHYLEGFLVCGDAACTLNPIYAQGMTAALLEGQALARCLREQKTITGLARTFQTRLPQEVAELLRLADREDRRWPATEVIEKVPTVAEDAFPPRFSSTIEPANIR